MFNNLHTRISFGRVFPCLARLFLQIHLRQPSRFVIWCRYYCLVICLFLVLVGCGTIQVQQQVQPTVPLNTVVLTFAGMPLTAGQIDGVEIAKVQALIKEHRYTGTFEQKRKIEDFTLYALFDQIELDKLLLQYKEQTVDALIAQIAPLKVVNSQTAHQFYQTHPILFSQAPPQIHVREITVKDEKLSFRLLAQLHAGLSFSQLAQQYSIDPPQYRNDGGDLGWVTQGQMPPEWDTVAFALFPNQLSSVFQVANLYCILQMIEGPKYQTIPYDEVSPPVPVIAAKYIQQQQFLTWLSSKIIQESIIIRVSTYSSAVNNAMSDLQARPDQNFSEAI